jgi:hypothetical protein
MVKRRVSAIKIGGPSAGVEDSRVQVDKKQNIEYRTSINDSRTTINDQRSTKERDDEFAV